MKKFRAVFSKSKGKENQGKDKNQLGSTKKEICSLKEEDLPDSVKAKQRVLKDGYLLVAAIDFGTTYSGYAYSFVSDGENKVHEDIRISKGWHVMGYPVRANTLIV